MQSLLCSLRTSHVVIDELLSNNPDVQVRIIFAASSQPEDIRTPPVKHLLAIADKKDEGLLKQALDDWYLAPEKEYTRFAAQYPMNGALNMQDDKIKAMEQWCRQMEISIHARIFY